MATATMATGCSCKAGKGDGAAGGGWVGVVGVHKGTPPTVLPSPSSTERYRSPVSCLSGSRHGHCLTWRGWSSAFVRSEQGERRAAPRAAPRTTETPEVPNGYLAP